METELPDHQKFYKKKTAISKQIILLLQTKICIMYTHSVKNKNKKLKIMHLFEYILPWQPNHPCCCCFHIKFSLIQRSIKNLYTF